MSYVLPIATRDKLVGSAVVVGKHKENILLATALHLFGESDVIQVAIPPHGGNCMQQQAYPLLQTPALKAEILSTNPFADLAILSIKPDYGSIPLPKIVHQPNLLDVGEEIIVLGYPFAPLGSMLETWTPGHVSALAKRIISIGFGIDELVLSNVSHPGSSGSAVVGKKDGILYGILRGTLSPPEVMRIGNIPIATDTSVTLVSSAHYLHELIENAIQKIEGQHE